MTLVNNYYSVFYPYFSNNVQPFINKWKTIALIGAMALSGFTVCWLTYRHFRKRKIGKLYSSGLALYRNGKLKEAKKKFSEILKIDPSHSFSLNGIRLIQSKKSYLSTVARNGSFLSISGLKFQVSMAKRDLEEVKEKIQPISSDTLTNFLNAEEHLTSALKVLERMKNELPSKT